MDMVTIKIRITNEDLLLEEKTDVIIASLESIVSRLEGTGGNIQKMNAEDEDCTIEYLHLANEV